nr:hypothetical protein Iba_scaffold457127CG0010 [Ipomoea batatas]GME10348.1 hypothetical protein Iba_scaffold9932CG0010 [Ipomoea batatas]
MNGGEENRCSLLEAPPPKLAVAIYVEGGCLQEVSIAAAFVDGNREEVRRSPWLLHGGCRGGGYTPVTAAHAGEQGRKLVAKKAHCQNHAAAALTVAAIVRSSLAKGVRNSPS